jgi:hypothetical protein
VRRVSITIQENNLTGRLVATRQRQGLSVTRTCGLS